MNNNILELIGNTPMVRINKLNPNPDVSIYAKLEGQSIGGSIKDRVALNMIEQAEIAGTLTKDKIIVEASSGNTGIGIAMVGAVRGYRVLIVMSEGASVERRKIIRSFGAEVLLTSLSEGTDGAIRKVEELISDYPEKYFHPDQFKNQNNPLSHEKTAKEIWEQTKGKVTHLVAALGTSGTLMGLSKFLKRYNPEIQIVSVEPFPNHKLQGLKNLETAIVPKIFNSSFLDQRLKVRDEDGLRLMKDLAIKEGLFVGMSSGAAMWAAQQVAKDLKSGLVVVIFPDRGERYLSGM